MSAAAPHPSLDVAAIARSPEDVAVGHEIVRHRLSSRALHWTVALFFFLSLLSGLPIWTPLFGWMAYLLGGLSVCRVLHPWAGLLFAASSLAMFVHWQRDMRLRPRGSRVAPAGDDRELPAAHEGKIARWGSTTAARSCSSTP